MEAAVTDNKRDVLRSQLQSEVLRWLRQLPAHQVLGPDGQLAASADAELVASQELQRRQSAPVVIRDTLRAPRPSSQWPKGLAEALEVAAEARDNGRLDIADAALRRAYSMWDAAWQEERDEQQRETETALATRVAAIEAEEKVRALEAKEQEVRAEEDKQVRLAEQMRPANGLSSSGEKKEQPRKVDPIDSDPTVQKLRERLERLPALESRVRTSDELEAEVYILLMRGNVLMSAGLDADALISFWAAKTALDRLLALRASGPSANVPHSTQLCLDALSSAQLAPDMERKDQMHHPHLADPHPVSSLVYRQLGCACAHLQQWNLALQCFSAAKTMCFQSLSEETFEFIDTATALNNMAVCLFHLGRFRSSHFYLEAALELLQQRLQSVHPRVSIVVANLERVRQWRSTLPLEMTPPERAAQQGKPKPRKFRVRMNPLEKAMTLLRESVGKKSKKQKKKGGKSGAKKK